MNSASPSTVRLGYRVVTERIVIESGITRRWRTVISPSGSDSVWPVESVTSCSISATIRSASSSRPWMNSHRGLSGTLRRTIRTPSPSTAPSPKHSRQPTSTANRLVFRASTASSAPPAAPPQ